MRWNWNDLTKREKQVALLAIGGALNRFGIGHELGISKGGVMFHLHNIYRKLGIRYGRTQLAFEIGRHWEEIEKEQNEAELGTLALRAG